LIYAIYLSFIVTIYRSTGLHGKTVYNLFIIYNAE